MPKRTALPTLFLVFDLSAGISDSTSRHVHKVQGTDTRM
jgi:hypothetical protein